MYRTLKDDEMKHIRSLLTNVLFPASFFFTVYSIFIYLVNSTADGGKDLLKKFLLVLTYCLIIALANNIFKTELSMLVKIVIHYLAFLLPLIGIVVIIGNNNAIGGVFILVTVVYAIIATPILLIRTVLRKKENEDQKYDSQFK